MIWVMLIGGGIILWVLRTRSRRAHQFDFIEELELAPMVVDKFRQHYPEMDDDDLDRVTEGLKDYFKICRVAGHRMAAMPSKVVDDLWHEFILFTREYERFCKSAFGYFLHHTPAEAMSSPTVAQVGIRRTWRLACSLENINPRQPHRLPRLFALDTSLDIEGGYRYSLDCTRPAATESGHKLGKAEYCGSHIGCASCGGSSGAWISDGGGDAADGCGTGCGGGCGGD